MNNGGDSTNRPISYVSWFDAARFANWLHNGQGSSSTETGAYTLVGGQTGGTPPTRNANAQFTIPTENEWFKAAYYKGGSIDAGYWGYATQSNVAPGNTIDDRPNQANYYAGDYAITQLSTYSPSQNYLTAVGSLTGSPSAYGTFDQDGSVWELFESPNPTFAIGARGGDWAYGVSMMGATGYRAPLAGPGGMPESDSGGGGYFGFRLTAPIMAVPEPSPYAMTLGVLICGGLARCLRKKRVHTTADTATHAPSVIQTVRSNIRE